jgi:hypothetical protein
MHVGGSAHSETLPTGAPAMGLAPRRRLGLCLLHDWLVANVPLLVVVLIWGARRGRLGGSRSRVRVLGLAAILILQRREGYSAQRGGAHVKLLLTLALALAPALSMSSLL